MAQFHPAFVSHTHADNDLCDTYIRHMIEARLDVWYDRLDMQLGPLLPNAIEHEITKRPAFILMMTEAALRSFWVRLELATFIALMAKDPTGRFLIPVKIGPCEVPPIIEAFPWVDALALGYDQTIASIKSSLAVGSTHPLDLAAAKDAPERAVGGSHERDMRQIVREAAQVVRAPAPVSRVVIDDPRLDFLPRSLAQLGFQAIIADGGARLITPPLCDVLSGPFEMGTTRATDPLAYNDERPPHTVSLHGFRIGRFPVTVAEYDCAVRTQEIKAPEHWEQQLTHPDRPVVYVSWDDAVDYAAWLARHAGAEWRLPTEAEWEKAARWDDLTHTMRRFPWGDEWEAESANTREQNRRAPSAVGSFPRGASPCGALDMCGNVAEWTHSLYRPYPYSPFDGRESDLSADQRVIRGGSWFDYQQDARTTFRVGKLPIERLNTRGFRLALSGLGAQDI